MKLTDDNHEPASSLEEKRLQDHGEHATHFTELYENAKRWSEWKGLQPDRVEHYSNWFADQNEDVKWSSVPPHRVAYKRFERELREIEESKSRHPAFRGMEL